MRVKLRIARWQPLEQPQNVSLRHPRILQQGPIAGELPFDGPATPPPHVLQHRAVLQTPDGRPFSLLVETYTDRVLAP